MNPRNNTKKKFWKRQKDTVKKQGEIFRGGRPTDVIIPVMGKTGVGKSDFINTLLGAPRMKVGHDIVSCTADLQWEVVNPALIPKICPRWDDRRVVIVDTPGFDDTYQDDAEILRRIAAWLASSYADDMKLGGIIYLHNIVEPRMDGTSRRNLEMFKKLCGTEALPQVVLGTTRWQEIELKAGEAREASLKQRFWSEMIASKSKVMRFDHTQRSAFSIIEHVLERHLNAVDDCAALRIQKELVDMKKHIPQTDAGKELLYSIEQILEAHKQMQPDDGKEKEELLKKVQVLETQMKAMRLPFFTRLKSLFGL